MPMVEHRGGQTTRVVIGKKLYWHEMKDDIKHFMHTYVKCQNTKSIYKKKYRLYKLPSIPNELWEIVSMDFMTQLPKWNGHHFGDS